MINFVFIHGVSSQKTGYSNRLFKNITKRYISSQIKKGIPAKEAEAKAAAFRQRELLWANVTTDLTNRYLALEYELYGGKKGFWNKAAKAIDPLALQIMYYIKDKGDKASGIMNILEEVDRQFKLFAQDTKDTVVIAHSLGSVIAFDYIFAFRRYSLDAGCNVLAFITMGSPVPIFTSAMGHADSELELPQNVRSWHNLLDKNDVIARSCEPFFQKMPLKDVKVKNSMLPLPLSAHAKYWLSNDAASKIAEIVSEF